jgi:hypothetical protein
MLAALIEQIVPAPECVRFNPPTLGSKGSSPDQTTLVLIVDEVQPIGRPGLSNLLEELFQSHFPLSLEDDLLDQGLVLLEIEVVHLAQRHASSAVSIAYAYWLICSVATHPEA